MNCKQGDLAVYVRSVAGNLGKIVRCVRFVGHVDGWSGNDRWETDSAQTGCYGGKTFSARDAFLKPIRDPGDDAQDESKAWLPPVPTKEHA